MKKSGYRTLKDAKKRKEEDKLLAGSMRSFLLGKKTRDEPRARSEDQETTVSGEIEDHFCGLFEEVDDEVESNEGKEAVDDRMNTSGELIREKEEEEDSEEEEGKEEEKDNEIEQKGKMDKDEHGDEEEELEAEEEEEEDGNAKEQAFSSTLFNVGEDVGVNHDAVRTFDPSSIVGKNPSVEEKYVLLEMDPCQPSMTYLSQRKKMCKSTLRCCSQNVFYHDAKLSKMFIIFKE